MISAVAAARAIYPSSCVVDVTKVMVSKMAAKGAPKASVIAATTMHVTSKPTGTLGKSRLRASATVIAANIVGKIGPPRYPALLERARRRIFKMAKPRRTNTPYAAGLAAIVWISDSPENITSGTK